MFVGIDIGIFIISSIVIGIIIIAVVLSQKNISNIELEEGEKLLFTDTPKYYMLALNPAKPTYFYRAGIDITSKRIVCYQRALIGKKRVISAVLNYKDKGAPVSYKDIMGGFLFKKGYMEFFVTPDDIGQTEYKKEQSVEIMLHVNDIPLLMYKPRLIIKSSEIAKYLKLT